MELRGIVPALTTPFDADGAIDETGLRTIVERHVAAGVGGLVVCGSTGEFSTLSAAERRRAVEVVLDHADGRVPVMAQTGAVSTAEAIDLSRHAAGLGAAALLCIPPYYEALTRDELARYYASVVEAVDVPVVFYNIPSLSKVVLDAEQIAALTADVGIAAVKDSSGRPEVLTGLLARHPELTTFNGWDVLTLYSFVLGGRHSIWGAATFMPELCVGLLEAVERGEMPAAVEIWARLSPVLEAMGGGSYVASVKAACDLLGAPGGAPRRPLSPLSPAAREGLGAALAHAGVAPW